ncbi:hypothetical protein H0H92_003873 [Tricholoma furcatifolium]|nr:hypothetical protein H0H92_003873 [Tricholoma furcatifolium]
MASLNWHPSAAPLNYHMDPIGVLRLTIQSAYIIPWSRLLGGAPNPFVSVHINDGPEVAKTKHLSHDFEPTWMETKYIVIYSLSETLNVQLYNYHELRRHALLGETQFELSQLREEEAQRGHNLPLIKDDKQRGDVLLNVAYYPVSEGDEDGSGIVTVYIVEARDLDVATVSLGTAGQLSLGYEGRVIHATDRIHGRNPVWKARHDFYCRRRDECLIAVKLVDEWGGSVGELSLALDDLLEGAVEWWPLSGCPSGSLRLYAQLLNIKAL